MTYLSTQFCRQIIKKSIATAVKLLCELDELQTLPNIYQEDKIESIKRELICINSLIEVTNKYIEAVKIN